MTEPGESENTPTESATGWVPEFDNPAADEYPAAADYPVAADHDHPEYGALAAHPIAVLDETPQNRPANYGAHWDEDSGDERDWAWVEEWRDGGEPTPWGPGLALAAFAACIVGIAIYVITAGLIDRLLLAIIANVVIAGGLSPALYMARKLPVLRWVSLGGAIGAVLAWIAVLFFPVITGT